MPHRKIFSALILLLAAGLGCRKPFTPPAILSANRYLVVDGYINTNPNDVTEIILSRSHNLNDTSSFIPELNATLLLVGSNGSQYQLIDSNADGHYKSGVLTLDPSQQYGIQVTTSDSHTYASDLVPAIATPTIDSLHWRRSDDGSGVVVEVNTHDPNNNTRYYRWDYSETWQHNAPEFTYWVLDNGMVSPLNAIPLDDPRQTYSCWTTLPSDHINVGTSLGLTQDVISREQVKYIPPDDVRLTVRFSILVKQYGLTETAFNYWQLIENNSQNLGGLFDLKPSQLVSNIHCTSNPDEPVIGYISAGRVSQQRLFINHAQVPDWIVNLPHLGCQEKVIAPADINNPLIYNYSDTSFRPWYFVGSNPPLLMVAKRYCVDCTTSGGTTVKPNFW